MQSRVIGMATIVAISFADALHTARADYAFINVADTTTAAPSGAFKSFDARVSISGSTVAFRGSYSGGEGIFIVDGNSLSVVAETGNAAPSATFTGFTAPSIDGNAVAFAASFGGGSGVFIGSGGALTTIAKTGDVVPSTGLTFGSIFDINFGLPAISGGNVAFTGYYGNLPLYDTGVFRGSGGALTTIAKTGDPAPGETFGEPFHSGVSINGNSVAFSNSRGVYTGSGGSITRIAFGGESTSIGVIPAFLPGIPSISGDTVALLAPIVNPQAGFTAILVGNGGPLTSVVKTGDTVPVIGTVSATMQPSISGTTVAFWASQVFPPPQPARAGIFVRRGDGPIEKVIVEGEPLFGSTVTSVVGYLDAGGSGNLAVGYSLADGRQGVALAYVIPEPAALALIAVVTLATALRPRRCRRQSSELRETQIVLHEALATKGVRS